MFKVLVKIQWLHTDVFCTCKLSQLLVYLNLGTSLDTSPDKQLKGHMSQYFSIKTFESYCHDGQQNYVNFMQHKHTGKCLSIPFIE